MRIDVHAHYWTDAYLDMLVDLGRSDTATQRGIGAGGGAELDARLRLMDRAGIDIQVLSAAPQLPYGDDEARATAAARYVNDEYAALVSGHPDRFRSHAATPMPHIDASVAEMCRAIDELGMAGLTMNTSILGRAITDLEFEPVFAELDRRAAILYLHPVGNGAYSPLVSEHHITWMVGAPFEDTIAAMQLITLRAPATVSRREDHLLASRRYATDDSAACGRPCAVGGAGHPGGACHCGRQRNGTVPDQRLSRLALPLGIAQAGPEPGGFANRHLHWLWLPT
jgi:hypothetical protein